MNQLSIFISSAYKGLELEREFVALVCKEMHLTTIRLPEQSAAGSLPRDYLQSLRTASIDLLLVGDRKSLAVDEETLLAKQIGIPIIPLFKKYAGRISKESERLKEKGIGEFSRSFETLAELKQQVQEAISELLHKRFHTYTGLQFGHDPAYEQASQMVQDAAWRVVVVQKTSSMILGPRSGKSGERRFILNVESYLDRCRSNPELQFIHVFSIEDTKRELYDSNPSIYPESERYLGLLKFSHGLSGVKVVGTTDHVDSLIICDDSLGIGFDLGTKFFVFSRYQGGIANQLVEKVNEILSGRSSADQSFLNSLLQE